MSVVKIYPSVLSGRILIPPSKSAAHRAVICSALANGPDVFPDGAFLSKDIAATRLAMNAIQNRRGVEKIRIHCGESGSTLRFLIPIAAALGIRAEFVGQGRLPERPIGVYLDCLPKHGVLCRTEGGLPLSIEGKLSPGEFVLPGNVSSQFITGLLLALPLLSGDSRLMLSSPLESAGYVALTIAVMRDFGVTVEAIENGWQIPGGQAYCPRAYSVEHDWSQAAFFLAAGALGGRLELEGLNPSSFQGDRAAEQLFQAFGAKIEWNGSLLSVSPNQISGMQIDASQIPDLVPILAATAALGKGETEIFNAQRLRIKESDRLEAMVNGLSTLGGKVRQTQDGLLIDGVERLHGGTVDGCNDHRIVMALAIAALNADGCVTISDAQSIDKSYPTFFEDYNRLGGNAHVVHMG